MAKSDSHKMDEAGWRRVFDAISDIVFITSLDHTLRDVVSKSCPSSVKR